WLWRTDAPEARPPRHLSPPAAIFGARGKDVRAVAWTGEETRARAIAWRNSDWPREGQPRPIPFYEWSFDLRSLEPRPAAASFASLQEAKLEEGAVRLKQETPFRLAVEGRDLPLALEVPDKEPIRCCTLLGAERAVLGTDGGLYLYDTATGR